MYFIITVYINVLVHFFVFISINIFFLESNGVKCLALLFIFYSSSGSLRLQQPLRDAFPSAQADVSSEKELLEFISSGPILKEIGLTPEKVAESIDKWTLYGSKLCSRFFKTNELYLTKPQKIRIYHYYVPVFLWCEQEVSRHRSMFKEDDEIPPLVVNLIFSSSTFLQGLEPYFLFGSMQYI